MRIKLISLLLLSLLVGCSNQEEKPSNNDEVIDDSQENVESEAEKTERLQAEYEANESLRKEELKEFYVPLPSPSDEVVLETEVVKALFVTFNIAGFSNLELTPLMIRSSAPPYSPHRNDPHDGDTCFIDGPALD